MFQPLDLRGDYLRDALDPVLTTSAGASASTGYAQFWKRPKVKIFLEPLAVKWTRLTSLKEKLVKIGAKIVTHARYVTFQMAEVAVPRLLFAEILHLIRELRPRLPPAPT